MGNYIKITEELPIPKVLVWCKRKSGTLYLAKRDDRLLATSEDPSQQCYWRGQSSTIDRYTGAESSYFSDITVDSWCYIEPPKELSK